MNNYDKIKQDKINPYSLILIQDLIITAFSVYYIIGSGVNNCTYISIFTINCFIVLWCMLDVKKQPFSLKLLVNIFIYIFFILANAIQFGETSVRQHILSFSIKFTDLDFIFFQICVLFIIILYNFSYRYFTTKKLITRDPIIKLNSNYLIITSIVGTLAVLSYYKFNFFQLFFRGLSNEMMVNNNIAVESSEPTPTLLLFNQFIRPIPWACFLIASINSESSKWINRILLFFTIITIFPTGLSRNQVGMYWLPIFLIFSKKLIVGRRFVFIMLFGILVIFPFLDIFRYFGGDFEYRFSLDYLNSMNFDAGQMFMAVITTNFITYGYQLLGVFLFFVPRSIWAAKPFGSGYTLAMDQNGFFTNVSMPYFGEGYCNFGFLGVFIFIIFLGYFTKKWDSIYWKQYHTTLQECLYLVLCGAIIFILRGDLMSSFSYTVGTCVSIISVYKIASIESLRKI